MHLKFVFLIVVLIVPVFSGNEDLKALAKQLETYGYGVFRYAPEDKSVCTEFRTAIDKFDDHSSEEQLKLYPKNKICEIYAQGKRCWDKFYGNLDTNTKFGSDAKAELDKLHHEQLQKACGL